MNEPDARPRAARDALGDERQDLASLYEVSAEVSAASNLADLLDFIIQKATLLVGAERGFVVLVGPAGTYSVAASGRPGLRELAADESAFSTSLVARVIGDVEPVLTTNIQEDGRYELSQSIITQQIRSVLAVPLSASGETIGAIYVDTRLSERLFTEADLQLLQAMATQAAMAIRNARLYQEAQASNERLAAAVQELRQTQEQLVQAERLAAVGRLAASVAHELRNPLTVMRSSLFFLDRLATSGEALPAEVVHRYVGKLDAEIERQSKIINDLLFFSRNRPRVLGDVNLNALLQETLLRVTRAESIAVELDLDESLPTIRADGDQVQQVFVNLIANAVQAMRGGVGISEENQAHLFEPFFTTRENGIGLGLAVTRSIVEGHRGTITARSREGEGTTFTVSLPLVLLG